MIHIKKLSEEMQPYCRASTDDSCRLLSESGFL